MYTKKPSVVIINGANQLGLDLSKKFESSSHVLVVDKITNNLSFPKHVSVVDNDSFQGVKLSKIKTLIVLYHDDKEDLISASDLVDHAKFISDIFNIGINNKARIFITTSLAASKKFALSKFTERDQPYDFASFQNFIERLALENNRKCPTYVLRLGDLYTEYDIENDTVNRMIKDALGNNFISVEDDGLEKIYPISSTKVAEIIHHAVKNNVKSGIYTVAPSEGLTQMMLANLCMQFTTHVSHIKFIKNKSRNYIDPMYENIYSAAPYLLNISDLSLFENDFSYILKNSRQKFSSSLRAEDDFIPHKKFSSKSKYGNNNKTLMSYETSRAKDIRQIVYYSIGIIIFLLICVPQILLYSNHSMMVTDTNAFFNDYSKNMTANLPHDATNLNKKATELQDNISWGRWVFVLTGDDYDANQNFISAEKNYFEALSYSSDYRFLTISDASRSVVQLKLQNAKFLINSVDKNKLYGDFTRQYEQIKTIINDAKL